jgi:D-alanyl-lipoteichoic acid acyltransferase DltB (MBOAT superfamily)
LTFNSWAFAAFFPIVTLLYFLLPHRLRWMWLVAASCYFYMYWNRWLIFIIMATVTVDYFAALGMAGGWNRKVMLVVSLASNLGVLAFFKYTNFIVQSVTAVMGHPVPLWDIILPIGISFHTFQAMSYTIDVYRKEIPAEHHYGHYLLYVLFYPQLVSGPIERASRFLPQLQVEHHFEYGRVVDGLQLMLWGLFKKCVVADTLAEYVNTVYAHPQEFPGFPLVLATWYFAFQIYCDFSGYTDIAIGAARVMGFDLMRNFNRPYVAASVGEFWHRWHISLSTWFRDYLYKPLGGNRAHWLRNVMAVFLLSGLWHGANWTYVAWGGLHGIFLAAEKALSRVPFALPRPVKVFLTFNLVCLGWIFFRATSLHDAGYIVSHLSLSQTTTPLPGEWSNVMALLALLLLFIESRLGERTVDRFLQTCSSPVRWGWTAAVAVLIVLMMPDAPSSFIYFQF